jgi:hypothetical protein
LRGSSHRIRGNGRRIPDRIDRLWEKRSRLSDGVSARPSRVVRIGGAAEYIIGAAMSSHATTVYSRDTRSAFSATKLRLMRRQYEMTCSAQRLLALDRSIESGRRRFPNFGSVLPL